MKTLTKTIKYLYLSLFFFTPLIFSFYNSELFELPKMYFVYSLTIVLVTLHLINFFKKKTPLFRHTILDIPLFLFLISQTISTFISIDITTSFFGYYSRLNGGLLSIISFTLLYWVLVVYIDKDFKRKIINTILFSGLLVSLFGIAEHFGIDKHIWVQDVQSRVFSTLGQPNWLATYLVMIIPLSLAKFLESEKKNSRLYFFLTTAAFYLCLLFTKSKSGIIASIVSLLLFFFFYLIKNKSKLKNSFKTITPILLLIVLSSLLINNPIKDKLFSKLSTKEDQSQTTNQIVNITPSGDIRKIVWQGSLDLWRQYPLFGTGTETFAYSYYWTRPASHNLTSEWDFLYNKAHNEYLNFLATTGIVGLVAYLLLIIFILVKTFHNKAIFTAILAFLITNIAGFSVVITSLFLFTLPALTLDQSKKKTKLKKDKKYLIPIVIFLSLIILQKNINFFIADYYYSKAIKLDKARDYQTAYQLMNQSLNFRPNQPEYLVKSASLASKLSITTKEEKYIYIAIENIDKAIKKSPANINFWKERAQIYYYLSSLDTQYFQSAINSLVQIQALAPTDAKNLYTIAQFLESAELFDQSIPYYQKAIKLKSNYDHAYFALGEIYFNQENYDLAKENLNQALKYAPNNTYAQKILDQISEKDQ